jgi:hypothetical protein
MVLRPFVSAAWIKVPGYANVQSEIHREIWGTYRELLDEAKLRRPRRSHEVVIAVKFTEISPRDLVTTSVRGLQAIDLREVYE